jgi:hypothetical protein
VARLRDDVSTPSAPNNKKPSLRRMSARSAGRFAHAGGARSGAGPLAKQRREVLTPPAARRHGAVPMPQQRRHQLLGSWWRHRQQRVNCLTNDDGADDRLRDGRTGHRGDGGGDALVEAAARGAGGTAATLDTPQAVAARRGSRPSAARAADTSGPRSNRQVGPRTPCADSSRSAAVRSRHRRRSDPLTLGCRTHPKRYNQIRLQP